MANRRGGWGGATGGACIGAGFRAMAGGGGADPAADGGRSLCDRGRHRWHSQQRQLVARCCALPGCVRTAVPACRWCSVARRWWRTLSVGGGSFSAAWVGAYWAATWIQLYWQLAVRWC